MYNSERRNQGVKVMIIKNKKRSLENHKIEIILK